MKYLVARYEDNGYHDSYFYAVIFDTDKNRITQEEEGATAYGNGWAPVNYLKLNTASPEIQESFKNYCLNTAADMILIEEAFDIKEPRSVQNNDQIIVNQDVKSRKQGLIPKGIIGRVFWYGAYGQFYKNGYNRPNRYNTRIGIETEAGDKYFINLEKCSRNKRIRTLQEIKKGLETEWNSKRFNIRPLTGCKAWFSETYIF